MIEWRALSDVNYGVNTTIRYKPDRTVHGKPEYWQKPSETLKLGTGDCEDYAILKAHLLVKHHGADPNDMQIVVVKEPGAKTLHAVLLARSTYTNGLLWWKKTHDCHYVLDNMRDDLVRWSKSSYELIATHACEKFFDVA